MSRGVMVSAFDRSTVMARPWAEAGYTCYCVDLQHPAGETRDGNVVLVGADVRTWLPPRESVVFSAWFPPCTDVAVSGARWFKDKGLGALIDALSLFKRSVDLAEWLGAPWIIENPVSTVSTYWRAPDYSFDPCDYGDPWTKRTCLWTGRGFRMPPRSPVPPLLGSKMHRISPGPERANLRSETPAGFARAVFLANAPHLRQEAA